MILVLRTAIIFAILSSLVEARNLRGDEPGDLMGEDLGIRFSKVEFFDENNPPAGAHLPLTQDDYPIDFDTTQWLRQTQAVSIVHEDDCLQHECNIPPELLIQSIGGYPSHPSSNPNNVFWDELCEVVEVQEQRLNNTPPAEVMPMPKIWEGFDIHEVAEAVHDEYPGSHHVELIKQLLNEGATFDRKMIPTGCLTEFLRGVVALSELNTWTIATVGPLNFQIKWFAGRARPEEVMYKIHTGAINQSAVPQRILDYVNNLEYWGEDGRNFTAYPEGSPQHPAWPAMHSAASAGSMWIPVVLNLTPEQICEVKKVDWAVSYARTVAGVHYPSDNIAGLQLGQEIIARKLPRFLFQQYAPDYVEVRQKVSSLRFNWDEFLNDPICFPEAQYA